MGKRSVRENKNVYQLSREGRDFTREEAAERLVFLSPERIEKIESGRSAPHPDEVLAMERAYQNPELSNWFCTHECPIGMKYEQEVKLKSLAQVTVETLAALHAMNEEEKRLIAAFNANIARNLPLGREDARVNVPEGNRTPIAIIEGRYDPESFLEAARGLEDAPEGAERCEKCFTLRLSEAARVAARGDENGPFDYFTTTLTISPLKNADVLNAIGQEAAREAGSVFLPSDFKKKNGFLRSTLLSEQYDLYRQDYCGCVYSMLY